MIDRRADDVIVRARQLAAAYAQMGFYDVAQCFDALGERCSSQSQHIQRVVRAMRNWRGSIGGRSAEQIAAWADELEAADARQQDQEQADRQAPDPAPAPAPPSPIACPILQSQVAYAIDAAITEHAAQALHRDPCGCVHDGTAIVHWCRRSAPVDRAQDPQD